MEWDVQFHPAFEGEVLTFERDVRIALLAAAAELRYGAGREQKRVRIVRTDGRPTS